jgi:hypothetical protein
MVSSLSPEPNRAASDSFPGYKLGREVEAEFTQKAMDSGLTEEETKNAFNQNMLSTGLLAEGPREYSETFSRRWLVTAYEAGDVVLHTPYSVSGFRTLIAEHTNKMRDTRLDTKP